MDEITSDEVWPEKITQSGRFDIHNVLLGNRQTPINQKKKHKPKFFEKKLTSSGGHKIAGNSARGTQMGPKCCFRLYESVSFIYFVPYSIEHHFFFLKFEDFRNLIF